MLVHDARAASIRIESGRSEPQLSSFSRYQSPVARNRIVDRADMREMRADFLFETGYEPQRAFLDTGQKACGARGESRAGS
jgi:hypothetical protein